MIRITLAVSLLLAVALACHDMTSVKKKQTEEDWFNEQLTEFLQAADTAAVLENFSETDSAEVTFSQEPEKLGISYFISDFNCDTRSDSAFFWTNGQRGDSSNFIRFTSRLPSVYLPEKYRTVQAVQAAGDIDEDGMPEIFIIPGPDNQYDCLTQVFLFSLKNKRWTEVKRLPVYACQWKFPQLTKTEKNKYRIHYYYNESYTENYEGEIMPLTVAAN